MKGMIGLLLICTLFRVSSYGQTDVSGPQSGTWTLANSPYIVVGDVSVPSGATLTIEPGVEVKFDGRFGLTVWGTLIADGTSAQNITFTSNLVSPEPGDWKSIRFEDSSVDANCILDYCVIAYGGGGSPWAQHGAIELVNASPTISNCDISNNLHGIKCGGGSNPTISGNTFSGNTYTPIIVSLLADPVFSGNSFSGNGYKALGIVGETVDSSCTLRRRTVAGIVNITHVLMGDLTIASGVTLTIEPGVVVKLHEMDIAIFVDGTLNAEGTADSMIVFTSTKDDAHGDDTNNDGSATSPDAGDWDKIRFNAGSAGILNYCVIAYGGGYSWDPHGAIELVNASPTISNSDIVNNRYGIVCYGTANPAINHNNIYGNIEYGVYHADSVFTIDATNNWWGHNSGPSDTSMGPPDYNPDGLGDRVTDYVLYRPWSMIGIEEASDVRTPKEFSLSQNFPNPMFRTTSIQYAIPRPVHVAIKIYDASGRLIRTLVNERKSPNYYSVKWDGRDNSGKKLGSGIYFYRLEAGGFKDTKKMILLR